MTIEHQTFIWSDAASLHEQPVGRKQRRRVSDVGKYILLGIFATAVVIVIPMLLALSGIGMSGQSVEIAVNGAFASLLAITSSFVIIRRLLRFPLLQTYGYVALTFVSSFAVVAVGLKFFRIEFSSPQFFLAMVMVTG